MAGWDGVHQWSKARSKIELLRDLFGTSAYQGAPLDTKSDCTIVCE